MANPPTPKISLDRPFAVLAVAIPLILVLAVATLFAFSRSQTVRQSGRESNQRLLTYVALLSQIKDAETGQRGYLLTRNPDFLKPYETAQAQADQTLDTLTPLLKDRPEVLPRIMHVRTLIAEKLRELARTIRLDQQGKRELALEIVRAGHGNKIMEDLRTEINTLELQETAYRDKQRQQASNSDNLTQGIMLGGSAVLFILVLGSTASLRVLTRARGKLLDELDASTQNLSVTLQSIGDALLATDAQGKVTMMNPVAVEMTGWSEADAKGTDSEAIFRIVNEDTREKVVSPIIEAIRENRIVDLANHTILISKDGTERNIDDSGAPIRDREGNVTGAILIFRDVTDRKRDQRQLQDLTVRLRRAMAETHHRVKNNLQVVAGLVELQTGGKREGMVPVDSLYRVRQHVVTMAAIHDLLTQEAEEGSEMDTMQMKTVMEKLAPLLQSLAREQQITFEIEPMILPLKMGTSLTVLVNELVSNAQKHGAGDIRVILNRVENGQGRLTVQDNGEGFPADFDPQKAANTGLQLIDSLGRWDLGGKVRYENRPEGGGNVSITFPLPIRA